MLVDAHAARVPRRNRGSPPDATRDREASMISERAQLVQRGRRLECLINRGSFLKSLAPHPVCKPIAADQAADGAAGLTIYAAVQPEPAGDRDPGTAASTSPAGSAVCSKPGRRRPDTEVCPPK
jgi:hypothetical protein